MTSLQPSPVIEWKRMRKEFVKVSKFTFLFMCKPYLTSAKTCVAIPA